MSNFVGNSEQFARHQKIRDIQFHYSTDDNSLKGDLNLKKNRDIDVRNIEAVRAVKDGSRIKV